MKYFEKNPFATDDLDELQHYVLRACEVVTENLTYHMIRDDATEHGKQVTLVSSAYALITVAEAIAEQFPEDIRQEAYDRVAKRNAENFEERLSRTGFQGAFEIDVHSGSDAAELLKKLMGL